MENKIFLSESKILEHNEKAFKDTKQLLSKIKEDDIVRDIELCNINKDYIDIQPNMHFDKGRTIWLELEVNDSYLSGNVLSWMYSKSDFDNTDGLNVFGCKLNSIMFSKPI